jgi:hypothetical protein
MILGLAVIGGRRRWIYSNDERTNNVKDGTDQQDRYPTKVITNLGIGGLGSRGHYGSYDANG